MSSNTNTIVLITGANTGLGFETVKAFCQSETPYTILLGGRSIDKANAAAKTAQDEFPSSKSTIKSVQIDIEDDESITRAFEHVSTEYGRVDVLINNAGKSPPNNFKISQRTVRVSALRKQKRELKNKTPQAAYSTTRKV